MDESTCMVDVARYFLQFVQSESCGKCTPCRVGTKEMLQILDAVCEGKATSKHIDRLERLAEHVGKASLCGLGQTAPNPVLTTLRYFRNEYEDHIEKNQCPAFVCTPMISFHIDTTRCTTLGKELKLDLVMVFIGLWCEWEMVMILEDHGLIDEFDASSIYDMLETCSDPEHVLRPIVQKAFHNHFNPSGLLV